MRISAFSIHYTKQVALKDKNLKELYLNCLLKNLKKTFNETMVYDAVFCYFSAGNTYIFLKLYSQTGNIKFKVAALFWLDKTIEFGNNRDIVNFTYSPDNKPV